MTSNPLLTIGSMQKNAPKTIAGYSRFRQVIDNDSALPARLKGLFLACAACIKNYEEMALRELKRSRDLGLTEDEARSAMTILSSVRGEGAALRFRKLFQETYPEAVDTASQPVDLIVSPGEAEANFLHYFDTMPPSLGKLLELVPTAGDAYYLMRRGSIDANPLSPKHGELLLLAILAAGYSPMAQTHVRGARNAGATDEEIAEAVLCAVPSAGVAAWMGVGAMLAPPET